MTRVAAIDCGTNSIRLLVADIDVDAGTLRDVDRRMEIVRLGQGVDRTGRFALDALERTMDACRRYADVVRATGAERVRFVATSASRDVSNRDEFEAGVRGALGVEPEVVTGDEEAALSFAGATRELAGSVPVPVLVVDIGGGSTEFVLGSEAVRAARSVDIGCVRMTERHLHSDPPTEDEIAAASMDIDAAVAEALQAVPVDGVRTLVGLAGSVTTVTAQAWSLPYYDPRRIHLAVTPVSRMRAAARELLGMTRAHRAALPFMHPGRVDVIGAGALVWDVVIREVAERSGRGDQLTVVSSEHDILDGLAVSLV